MTIEIALLLSALSLAFGVYAGVSNLKRNERTDNKTDASQLTTVIVKLENISAGVSEIKAEMINVKSEIRETREKLVRVEESTKQAHRRIDGFEKYKRLADDDSEQ